jgi:hypothetical protein
MTRAIGAAVAAAILVGFGRRPGGRARQGGAIQPWSAGPTGEHLESLGQLVTARLQVSDVMTASDDGYLGSRLIRGEGLLSIDMHKAEIVALDRGSRRARIRLPRPAVLSARVDHGRTKTWDVKRFSRYPWRGDADALRDRAMHHAQELVERAVASAEYSEQAKGTAEAVVTNMYRMVDWQVTVEWSDPGGDRGSSALIDGGEGGPTAAPSSP